MQIALMNNETMRSVLKEFGSATVADMTEFERQRFFKRQKQAVDLDLAKFYLDNYSEGFGKGAIEKRLMT